MSPYKYIKLTSPAYAQVESFIHSQENSLDHFTRAIQGSPDWGTTDLGWHPYLVNVWQAAASRITGDTTSWVAWRDVGHLWMQAVSQVKSAEVCGELHVHTYTTYTQMVSMSQHSHHCCSLTPTLTTPIQATYNQKYYQYNLWQKNGWCSNHKAWSAMFFATEVVQQLILFLPNINTKMANYSF